jgi:acetyl-CoA decarbonylase/synthase complex subunit beta
MKGEIPVKIGVVYEGERIRGPDTFLELGGPKQKYKAELVQTRKENEIEDGKVILIGKDIPEFKEGDKSPFGILVEVYGKSIEKDLEAVIERRIHDFLNYIQGFMHLNQRYDIWCRISKEAKDSGLRFEHIGSAMMDLFKKELSFIDKIQVTFITNEERVREHYEKALEIYEARDKRVRGMKDKEVDVFYGCTLCQSFAPNHVCIISPQRVSLCGSISWLDARAAARVDPEGPNFAVEKGELLDEANGEYSGVNEVVREYTHGANDRFYMYSMFNFPHTSCGCFEAIAFYIPEVDGIGIVDRHFTDKTVNGLKFSSMATQTGGGEQTEGFLGLGIEWAYSQKFFSADGGWKRIVWLPEHMKGRVKEAIPKELYDKIPTGKDVKDIDGLKKTLQEREHPVVERWVDVKKEVDEGGVEEPVITAPRMEIPDTDGVTILLKNARIYAEKVIVKRTEKQK